MHRIILVLGTGGCEGVVQFAALRACTVRLRCCQRRAHESTWRPDGFIRLVGNIQVSVLAVQPAGRSSTPGGRLCVHDRGPPPAAQFGAPFQLDEFAATHTWSGRQCRRRFWRWTLEVLFISVFLLSLAGYFKCWRSHRGETLTND